MTWYRPTLVLAGMAAVTLGLSAIRLFPLLDLVLSHARPVEQKDQTGPLSIVAMLAIPREHSAWGAGAGDFYVGSWIFLLGCLALIANKRSGKFWAIALVFGALACGEFVENAPYVWLRKLPVFSQLRFPMRMATISALFIALAAALGLTRIEDGARTVLERGWRAVLLLTRVVRWVAGAAWKDAAATHEAAPLGWKVGIALVTTAVAALIAAKSATDVVTHNHIAKGLYNMAPPLVYEEGFRQSRGNRWDAHVWPYANRGSLHCFEEHELFVSPYLRGDLQAEEYPAPDTTTQVERLKWSPHEIVVRAKSTGEGRFLVNQNHANAWKTDVGTLSSDGGLISVRVPPGEHVVTLRYSDWKVHLGTIVTLATVLAIAFAFFKRARRRAFALRRLWRILASAETAIPTAAGAAAAAATTTAAVSPTSEPIEPAPEEARASSPEESPKPPDASS